MSFLTPVLDPSSKSAQTDTGAGEAERSLCVLLPSSLRPKPERGPLDWWLLHIMAAQPLNPEGRQCKHNSSPIN